MPRFASAKISPGHSPCGRQSHGARAFQMEGSGRGSWCRRARYSCAISPAIHSNPVRSISAIGSSAHHEWCQRYSHNRARCQVGSKEARRL
jgi:hypothetical protein